MTFIEKLVVTIVVIACISIFGSLFYPFGIMQNYSSGQRTGDIYKFSKKGIFYKSWEGEMYLGGYHSTGRKNPTIEADIFEFSIPEEQESEKKEIIEKIKKCSEERSTCTIEYTEWLLRPWKQSSGYTVSNIK